MGIFSTDKPEPEKVTRSSSRSTGDVATTGRARDLDIPERDRAEGQLTEREIRRAQK